MNRIFLVGLLLLMTCGVALAQEQWMPDPNLRQVVREALKLSNDIPLTRLEMNQLTGLEAVENQIMDLTGLEHAMSLTWLNLGVNKIRDLSPLAGLSRLEGLWIFVNPLSNLSPLANLVNLKTLDLGACQISDIRPLAALRNLESLRLHNNQIENITPLMNLTHLTELWLSHNQIMDVTPLTSLKNLTDLKLEGNFIRDFNPLFGLNLKNIDIDIHMLHELASVKIKITDPNLERAVRVTLGLSDEIPLTQLVMNQLTGLEANDSQLTDLTGLEHAVNLTWIDLGANEIRDLSPLARLIHLEGLWISENPISNLSPLANLVNLKTLDLGACQISDIRPLANLQKLKGLRLHNNQIEDITPLANLTRLTELWLIANHIADISPLENLTMLEELRIQHNAIWDYSPLDALSLTHFEYDESCALPRLPIQERFQNRSFPSIFNAWYDILNLPALSYEARLTHHDLHWSPGFGLHLQETKQGFQLVGNLKDAQTERNALLAQNPNMLFLAEIRMRDAFPDDYYDENWSYWITDAVGNQISAADDYSAFLIDFTHPDLQDIIVQQTLAFAKCGLYDGIFLDYWREDHKVLNGYRTYEAEQRSRDVIVQRIRAEVGDDFLIIVNPNRHKPTRAAPYINGLFMETLRDHDGGYTYNGLHEIESTLLWAEENLRSPRINSLEGWGVETESPDSPTNRRWMRVFTVMGLTHSDGYVLYITGIRHPIHRHDWSVFEITHKKTHDQGIEHNHHHDHYWYDFWDADLGQPIGEKAQLYENREGLFIREFTNGWAVYNRSGKPQEIRLPEQVAGVESGLQNTIHIVPDLDSEIYLKRTTDSHDVNEDGIVNILDLVAVANAFGKNVPDVNGDGVVNVLDLVAVANAFGQ